MLENRTVTLIGLVGLWVALLAAGSAHAASSDVRLIQAVKNGDRPAVVALLNQNVDVNATQGDGATALHWAAYRDELETVRVLTRAGANVNAANSFGVTPIYLACENGHAAIVEALLQAGADPHAALPSGETALMTAARSGSVGAVTALIASGANVNVRERRDGQTAIMWAAARRHPAVIEALIGAGADVRARSHTYTEMVSRGQDNAAVEMQSGGFTPLLFASRVGDVASARLLVSAGADVNDTTPDGASALVIAAHSRQTDVALYLLASGADPNAARAGYSALHLALLTEDAVLQEALLEHGADPNLRMTRGTVVGREAKFYMINGRFAGATPFFLAAKYADVPAMRRLVAAGADPLIGLPDGTTPLMMAAGYLMRGFGRVGADRRDRELDASEIEIGLSQDEDTRSIVESGIEAVKLAVALGADVNAQNSAGDTALHAAAALGFDTNIKFLVSQGATVEVKNKGGLTPLMTALRRRAGEKSLNELNVRDTSIGTLTVDLLEKLGEAQKTGNSLEAILGPQ